MKRHQSLYPLSHDHHHALVQARRLRIASSASEHSSFYQAAADFIAFWDFTLDRHFRQEEEILLPVFAKHSSADRAEIVATLAQHWQLRQSCGHLKSAIDQQTALASEGLELAELLVKHIRYEESDLFPAIEKAVPEAELWEINRLFVSK
jgi:hemerythrin-like domain-containing protein